MGELSRAVDYLADTYAETPKRALAVSVPFLDLLGTVACGWQTRRHPCCCFPRRAAVAR
ncbi:acyl-CoA dehydrogenase C-terminal domain-containing protein [Burkholderia sp. Ac-20345]|uniref:acyl-CoA dehydrogenase C-terminal domain-containing protein n=1 Tax=Burkholderia sp. Ac-20345 TaxID=2703891 RepID=UPI0032167CE2